MSSYTELLGYSKQLERRLAALERQEAGGAFYTRSEADAKFLTIADAADNYIDISAYGDFLLATGQATGALIFPQIFSRGIYSYDGIWGSGDPNGDLILEGTSDATKTSSYVILQPTGGKVGIGTSTPGDKLHVSGGGVAVSGGGVLLDNNNWFKVKNTGGTAIEIAGMDASNDVYLGAVSNAGGKVVLREDGADVVTISGANVGVGTTSPGDKLHVLSATAWQGITLESRAVDATSTLFRALKNRNGATPNAGDYIGGFEGRIGTTASNVAMASMNFYAEATTAGGEKGRLVFAVRDGATWRGDAIIVLSSGNVGIGTSSPGQALDVNGKIKLRGDQLIFEGGSGLGADQGDATATLYNRAGVGPTFSGLQVAFRTGATPAERLRIASDGKVGIGTTAPDTALHVVGVASIGGGSGALKAYDRTNGAAHAWGLYSDGNIGRIYSWGAAKDVMWFDETPKVVIQGASSSAGLRLETGGFSMNGSETFAIDAVGTVGGRFYVTAAGNVGIGTNNPGTKLHVSGGDVLISNNRWYYGTNAGGTLIRLAGIDGSSNVYLGAIDNAGAKVFIREDGADVITLHTGDVGIGTTNPQNFKLQVEGRVGVKTGVNAASAMMWVYQDDNGATIPVLRLTQSDLSEEFIYFNATVGTNYPIDTAALGTYYGKVRVSVNGTFKYMPLYNS